MTNRIVDFIYYINLITGNPFVKNHAQQNESKHFI